MKFRRLSQEEKEDLDKKFSKLEDKYFMNNKIDVFRNVNRYGKLFLRVVVNFIDKDGEYQHATQTFNWNLDGYNKAIHFIEKYERVL